MQDTQDIMYIWGAMQLSVSRGVLRCVQGSDNKAKIELLCPEIEVKNQMKWHQVQGLF